MSFIIHLSKPIEGTTPRVNPNINCGLRVVRMCRYGFIGCSRCTLWKGGVDNGGGWACVGVGGVWELAVPSFPFCCEPKTPLKTKPIKNNF